MLRHARRLGLLLLMACIALAAGCRSAAEPAVILSADHRFRETREPVISSPIAWDLDDDGVKEIAVGSWDGYFYLMDADLQDLPGWPKFSPKGFFSSPALADLDDDGDEEILVGAESGELFAWHTDGRDVEGFPVDLGYHLWATPAILEGPRMAVSGFESMVVLDRHGNAAPGWPQPMQGWADAGATTDGSVLAVTTLTPGDPSQGWLYAWSTEGEPLPGFPVELPLDSDSSPALADLDGTGAWWIVFGDDAGFLHAIDRRGESREGFPVRSYGPGAGPTPTPHPPGGNVYSIEASPAVADLDGDGRDEIAVGSWDGRMYLWDDDGSLMPGWPVKVGDQIIASAALVDLDGDRHLDIVVGSKDHYLYGWTVEADPLPGFPYDLGDHVFSSPWIGDLDGDGRADVVVGADNGIHVLRDVGPLGRVAWPTFRGDAARIGLSPGLRE